MRLATLILALAAALPGQQLEPNSPGGSLRSRGGDPQPGSPYLRDSRDLLDVTIGGNPNAPLTLVLGRLASTSTPLSSIGGQFLDLDIFDPFLIVLGDGIVGVGALSPFLFVTNPLGRASYSFPLNSSLNGQSFAMQALVADPVAPGGVNATAAGEWLVSDALVLNDTEVATFTLPGGPQSFMGTSTVSIDVSTSGWIRLGLSGGFEDPLPLASAFLNGTLGGSTGSAPVLAPYWSALTFPETLGSRVEVRELVPGLVQVDWISAQPLLPTGTLLGSFGCVLDFNGNSVTFDYTQLSPPSPTLLPISIPGLDGTLVGITDGGTMSAQVNEVNLVTGGLVNGLTGTGPQTIFQDFSTGASFGETVDLSGTILSFIDVTGSGSYGLF